MRYYACFYHRVNGQLMARLGSDGMFRLDARLNTINLHRAAGSECSRRGFAAYSIMSGTCFHDARDVTKIVSIENKTKLECIA